MPLSSLKTAPEERRIAFSAFMTLGLVLSAHAILETARDTLFLVSLPANQLPWVYLIIAALTLAVTMFETRVAEGVRRRDLLAMFLLGAAVVTGFLWKVADFVSVSSIWLLYVWTGVFATLATIHFWLSISTTLTVTQAKRLYGFVGAGAVGGAIAGSALARVLVSLVATRHLVLVAAVCMLLGAWAAHVPLRRALRSAAKNEAAPVIEKVRLRDSIALLRGDPYVQRVVLLVLLGTVALTFTNYLFKREVAAAIPARELGSFFATYYTALNMIALIVQLVLVRWLLDRAGVHRALCVLPALLFGGGLWVALTGTLPAVLALQGAPGSLSHSLHDTATEVLFVPLPGRERVQAKTVADVIGHRGGQAIGSLLILVGIAIFTHVTWLAWSIVALAVLVAIVAVRSREPYLDVFRRRLGAEGRRSESRLPPLDRHAIEALFAALDSPVEREVLASLDILHEQGRIDLVPALILHHPSPRVVRRALRRFVEAGRRDFVATALRIDTDDADLRAALLRAVAAVEPDERVLREAARAPSRRVRATAIVELTALGWMPIDEAERRLRELMDHAAARRAMAAALGMRACPALTKLLRTLAQDEDALVRAEAIDAMASWADPSFFPDLLTSLRERTLRPIARRGFEDAGLPALSFLLSALCDRSLPHEVRLHVPRSISRFRAADAAPPLWAQFGRETDPAVRAKILRALSSLARTSGGLPLDENEVAAAIAAGIARCQELVRWHATLAGAVAAEATRDTARGEVLRDMIAEELAHELEQVFRTLALRQPDEDFRSIHRGLSSNDPVVRASCEELLTEMVPHEDARVLLSLADFRIEERAVESIEEGSFNEALSGLIDGSNDAVSAVAAAYVAELGESELAERIGARLERTSEPDLRALLTRSLGKLRRRHGSRYAHG